MKHIDCFIFGIEIHIKYRLVLLGQTIQYFGVSNIIDGLIVDHTAYKGDEFKNCGFTGGVDANKRDNIVLIICLLTT